MHKLIEILHSGNHSLVVANGEIRTFNKKGVADLYHLYTSDPLFLNGSEVADKVIGKGAAALMVMGKVRNVYADVISEPALALLHDNHLSVTYSRKVENIINRQGTGICPVETLCLNCKSAAECLPLIDNFMKSKIKN
ncbi:MAG: DUF1893 domain-containing protein [Bacteroides sp.]|nr:DUF1893 domain-containing protein [Bacteroides sp.]